MLVQLERQAAILKRFDDLSRTVGWPTACSPVPVPGRGRVAEGDQEANGWCAKSWVSATARCALPWLRRLAATRSRTAAAASPFTGSARFDGLPMSGAAGSPGYRKPPAPPRSGLATWRVSKPVWLGKSRACKWSQLKCSPRRSVPRL